MTVQQSSSPGEADALTARVQSTWTSGDFGRIARSYERGAAEFIARLELEPGDEVLDVACGTGNLALPGGARRCDGDRRGHRAESHRAGEGTRGGGGAVDPVRRRRRRSAATTPTTSSTSRSSMFGAMFAARPDRAAAELLRVVRPGGRIAMANWTPMGFIGEMLKTTQHYAPAPAGVLSPLQWGTEYAVRERLGPGARSIEMTQRLIAFEFAFDPVAVVNEFITWYGPMLRAYASLDFGGRERAASRSGDVVEREQPRDGRDDVCGVGVSGGDCDGEVRGRKSSWVRFQLSFTATGHCRRSVSRGDADNCEHAENCLPGRAACTGARFLSIHNPKSLFLGSGGEIAAPGSASSAGRGVVAPRIVRDSA